MGGSRHTCCHSKDAEDDTQPNNPEKYRTTTTLARVLSSKIEQVVNKFLPVHGHYLSMNRCQSRIASVQGSNACTMISCLLANEVLPTNVDLPTYDHELASHPVAKQYVD